MGSDELFKKAKALREYKRKVGTKGSDKDVLYLINLSNMK